MQLESLLAHLSEKIQENQNVDVKVELTLTTLGISKIYIYI